MTGTPHSANTLRNGIRVVADLVNDEIYLPFDEKISQKFTVSRRISLGVRKEKLLFGMSCRLIRIENRQEEGLVPARGKFCIETERDSFDSAVQIHAETMEKQNIHRVGRFSGELIGKH